MLKKLKLIPWRRIARLAFQALIVTGFIVTVGFTEKKQAGMPCSEVIIEVKDQHKQGFIDRDDISRIVHDKFGAPEGKPMHAINISLLENIVNNDPFVSRAEVFSTIDGKLHIEVVPRNPVVRVMNSFDESFYIDDEGVFMPLSEKYSAPVPVASGFIYDREAEHKVRAMTEKEIQDTSFHPLQAEKIFLLASYIRRHDFWNAQVQQVFVNGEGEIELVPRVGNHLIVLGDLPGSELSEKELDEKFDRLLLFYKEGLNRKGWEKYSTINLKFKDQVVCTKK